MTRCRGGTRRVFLAVMPIAIGVSAPAASLESNRAEATSRSMIDPVEHGSHDRAVTEWWIFTGHVKTSDGRWFGYQAAFHRLDPGPLSEPVGGTETTDGGGWELRSLFPAVIAIVDLDAGRSAYEERLERQGPGCAGVSADRPELHVRSWRFARAEPTWILEAEGDSLGLALTLAENAAPVLVTAPNAARTNGATNAAGDSHPGAHDLPCGGYDLPLLGTRGTLRMGGTVAAVRGVSWLDHGWDASRPAAGPRGWDLLNLHFRDGAALSLFRPYGPSERGGRQPGGIHLSPSGALTILDARDVRFRPLREHSWRSPRSGAAYETRWSVEIPLLDLMLEIEASALDQELSLAKSHGASLWRGSVQARGQRTDRASEGAGYLEMIGYAGDFPPVLVEQAEADRDLGH